MQVTRRDVAILLFFGAGLTVGTVAVVRHVTGLPDDEGPMLTGTRHTDGGHTTLAEKIEPGTRPGADPYVLTAAGSNVPRAYAVIAERQLFKPLVAVRSKTTGGDESSVPSVPDVRGPVQSEETSTSSGFDFGGDGDSTPPDNPATQAPTEPPKPKVAVTGLLRWGDGYRVVIEHNEKRFTRIVKVGDEAFGYRVLEVDGDTGTVTLAATDAPDQPVTLVLGTNKAKREETAEPKPQDNSNNAQNQQQPQPPSPGGPPPSGFGGFGGFDPSRLSPEQRARWEDYRRRRGGGGGRDGG